MALVKLMIIAEVQSNVWVPLLPALFNPTQVSIQKNVNWTSEPVNQRDTPRTQFTNGGASILSLDLFFDTFEQGVDVRQYTAKVAALTLIKGTLHRPPICRLIWGIGIFFQGVLTKLEEHFTLFLSDGTPVRATLNCSFTEWVDDSDWQKLIKLQSSDVVKTRIVRRGDSLSSIAAEEYHDPTQWRPIAEANKIDDPRAVAPGTVLAIPILNPVALTTRA